jgi:hypothetical protein
MWNSHVRRKCGLKIPHLVRAVAHGVESVSEQHTATSKDVVDFCLFFGANYLKSWHDGFLFA